MTEIHLDAIAALIERFRGLSEEHRSEKSAATGAFLTAFQHHLTTATRDRRFNLLDVTGVRNDEVRHSAILAWLLTPHGSHGCGVVFLDAFLHAAGIDLPVEDLAGCRVLTEFPGDESIIDIVVYKPGSYIVYIENKTLAAEGIEQVDRELHDMLRLGEVARIPRESMFPVFLTPSGRPPISGDPAPWFRVSYGQLARSFDAICSQLPEKIAYFVRDLTIQYRRWSSA